jgi:hypothetical protein
MVRVVGIEPTLLSEPDFESGASTSFTTPASSLHSGRHTCCYVLSAVGYFRRFPATPVRQMAKSALCVQPKKDLAKGDVNKRSRYALSHGSATAGNET